MSRHLKSRCPVKLQQRRDDDADAGMSVRELQQGYQRLRHEMEEVKRQQQQRPGVSSSSCSTNNNNNTYNNTIHCQTQNTYNNTIQINALGKEDLSKITPQLVDTCIRRTSKGLVELVERIHFDTGSENQNLRASLQHPEHVEYHDGEGWKIGPRNRVVRDVVDSSHLIMSNRYDDNQAELRQNMSRAMFDFVDRWMNKMTKANAQVYVDVMSEAYCAILNRSRVIEDRGQ